MLAGNGPVKPFLVKDLIKHSEACGRTERAAHAQPRARAATHAPHRREPRLRVGAHMYVSAVSAEIVGGTVPTTPRLPTKTLRAPCVGGEA